MLFSYKAARKAHPDKGGSEAKMATVNEAYEVLSHPGEKGSNGKANSLTPWTNRAQCMI
jgi:curved DNA-binding protein CbpA